tara:strand:+ start:154 stop:504 length:351 start_codon:yes stop_codon:yes gene_type:complete
MKHNKKEALLKALEKNLGVVTTACKQVDVSRATFYRWLNEDSEFSAQVKSIQDVALDFAESRLFEQIQDGSTAATIFYLKTKGKRRGYVERQELEHTGGEKPVNIKLVIDEDSDLN